MVHPLLASSEFRGPALEALVEAFVRAESRATGLFIPRDEETVAVYRLLLARGVVPGRDVTVISCDNEEMRLSGLDPRPASIELGTVELKKGKATLRVEVAGTNDKSVGLRYMWGLDCVVLKKAE